MRAGFGFTQYIRLDLECQDGWLRALGAGVKIRAREGEN